MRDKLLKLRDKLQSLSAMSDEAAAVVELDQSKVGRLSRMDAMQAQGVAHAPETSPPIAEAIVADDDL